MSPGVQSSQQTRHVAPNAGLMLTQRRRRWVNISLALGPRIVFAVLAQRRRLWANISSVNVSCLLGSSWNSRHTFTALQSQKTVSAHM